MSSLNDIFAFNNITFWQGVFASILVGLLFKILEILKRKIKDYHYKTKNTSINGFWITSFIGEEGDSIEIYKFNQKSNKIKFKFQHYRKINNVYETGAGNGLLKSNYLVLTFYMTSRVTDVIGSWVIRTLGLTEGFGMIGNFYNYRNEDLRTGSAETIFYQIDLKFIERLKFYFNKPISIDYQLIKDLLEKRAKVSNLITKNTLEFKTNNI